MVKFHIRGTCRIYRDWKLCLLGLSKEELFCLINIIYFAIKALEYNSNIFKQNFIKLLFLMYTILKRNELISFAYIEIMKTQ